MKYSDTLKSHLQHLYWDIVEGKNITPELNRVFGIVLKEKLPNDIKCIRNIQDCDRTETAL